MISGCYHVYLDVGTNVGIQIRKLFQPQLYQDAKIHPVFEKSFNRKNDLLETSLPYICAVGFEPNAHHEEVLKSIIKMLRNHKILPKQMYFDFRYRECLQ